MGFFFAFRAIFHIVKRVIFQIQNVSLYKISPPRLGLSYRSRYDRDDTAKLSQK